jgi:endoglucanase
VRRGIAGVVLMTAVALVAAAVWALMRGDEAPAAAPVPAAVVHALHVEGNRLVDGRGQTLHLRGFNRSGTEYACLHGSGFFEGPADAASVAALAAWHVNFVRILLNEDCWLGINGVSGAMSGVPYRNAIAAYVRLLHRHGMYAEVSLIWGAPGTYQATYQSGSPDADHAPAAWASIATTFRNDGGVILAPWGETVVDPRCFRDGGTCEATFGPNNVPYPTAGMQQAVDVMRRAGYLGPIAIPGVNFANDLSQWLSHEPSDAAHQLIAEAHIYGNNTCSSTACLDRTLGHVAGRVPVVLGETGASYDATDCRPDRLRQILEWADSHGIGYAAWSWNDWQNCSGLISSYTGRPAGATGEWLRSYLTRIAPPPIATETS